MRWSLLLNYAAEYRLPCLPAIPVVHLSNILGKRAGNKEGSSNVPSKLGVQFTVPCSSSSNKFVRRGLNEIQCNAWQQKI